MQLSKTTAARLLAINLAEFDNVAASRSVLPHRPRYGTALTAAIFAAAGALLAIVYLL